MCLQVVKKKSTSRSICVCFGEEAVNGELDVGRCSFRAIMLVTSRPTPSPFSQLLNNNKKVKCVLAKQNVFWLPNEVTARHQTALCLCKKKLNHASFQVLFNFSSYVKKKMRKWNLDWNFVWMGRHVKKSRQPKKKRGIDRVSYILLLSLDFDVYRKINLMSLTLAGRLPMKVESFRRHLKVPRRESEDITGRVMAYIYTYKTLRPHTDTHTHTHTLYSPIH